MPLHQPFRQVPFIILSTYFLCTDTHSNLSIVSCLLITSYTNLLSFFYYPISTYSHQGISVSDRFVSLHLRIPHISSHFSITSIHLFPPGYFCLQSFCFQQWYRTYSYPEHSHWCYSSTSVYHGGRISSSLYPSCGQFCGCSHLSHYRSHCYTRTSIVIWCKYVLSNQQCCHQLFYCWNGNYIFYIQ